MIYGFIDKHRTVHAVERMCRVLGVTRSGYYGWKRRGQSRRVRRDEVLLEKIKESHCRSNGRYGSPNIHKDLQEWGFPLRSETRSEAYERGGIEIKDR